MDGKTLDNYCIDINKEVYCYYEQQVTSTITGGGYQFDNEPSESELYEIAHQYIMELGLKKAEEEELIDYYRIDMEELRDNFIQNLHEGANLQ